MIGAKLGKPAKVSCLADIRGFRLTPVRLASSLPKTTLRRMGNTSWLSILLLDANVQVVLWKQGVQEVASARLDGFRRSGSG